MKAKLWFHIKMISPELEFSEGDALKVLCLWCSLELHMPAEIIKAITIEKIEAMI